MRRKVIQIAGSTQLISLPRKWAVQHGIKKGDELEIEEKGNKILISTGKGIESKNAEIDPPHLTNVTERYITSFYRSGCKEIRVNYSSKDNPELVETLNKKMDDQTIGFEIVTQENDHFIIKDLSGTSETGFDAALRRTFVLLTTMVKDSLDALKKKDKNTLKNMFFVDRSINKFTNFCARELISKGQMDFKQTAFYYHFLRDFEALSDQFSLLAVHYSSNLNPLPRQLLVVYEELYKIFSDYYNIFYNYSKGKVNNLFKRIKELNPEELFKIKEADPMFVYYLIIIHRRIKELIDSLIDIHV
ncbi:AbrB/MazE/SpoVT family DNA-binding domain-containing protein [Candidatus Woesearchaeota archaeon]|nr:AbrB/MazE/SpoVT family DNA-binding domain-containing protein [Candidatus Woesearchaeota archaeon]